MFVNLQDLITVELYHKLGEKSKNLIVLRNLDKIDEKKKAEYTKSIFKLRPMNWKIYNDLQRESSVDKGTGDGEVIDWVKWKELKLLKTLADWDAKGKDGAKIPINQETIFSLHPMIAELLILEYDKKTVSGDE